MLRFKNPLILLTACVNPQCMSYTVVQDSDVRKKQYLESISFYLEKYKYKILFVENTSTDLSCYFQNAVDEERIEFLTFSGNDYDKKLGKGYGEGIILNYAFENSIFIKKCDAIIKVSGRHRLLNLKGLSVISQIFLNKNDDFIVCDILSHTNAIVSDCFIASKNFFKDYLNKRLCKCNDSQNVWFEHIFYECVLLALNAGYQILSLPTALDQRGVWGSTGEEFKPKPLKTKFHYFLRMLCMKYRKTKFYGKKS